MFYHIRIMYLKEHPSRKLFRKNFKPSQSLHAHFLQRQKQSVQHNRLKTNKTFVCLLYERQKIKLQVEENTPLITINKLLYAQLNKYFQRRFVGNLDKIKEQLEKILGFESIDGDFKFDYRFSLGKGVLKKTKFLTAFLKQSQEELDYKIYQCLAIGGFSKVYLARSHKDGRFYAIKFIKKKQSIKQKQEKEEALRNQIQISRQSDHPFLIKIYHAFQTKQFYGLVFQYCPGGQLFYLLRRVKRMDELTAKFYFLQILYAIQHLHSKSIIYRDLKPQNILIDSQGNCKVVDFGLSKKIQAKAKAYSFCGSAQYMAPEMIMRSGHSLALDYYSLGALLYQLVTGLPPFYTKDEQQLQSLIVYGELQFPEHISLSSQIKDFLSRLLQKNDRQRLGGYAGAKEIMFHPWVGKLNSNDIISKKIACPYPTNLEQHNFDQGQLGKDEIQFTNLVKEQMHQMTKHQYYNSILTKKQTKSLNDQTINQICKQNQTFQKQNRNNILKQASLQKCKKLKRIKNCNLTCINSSLSNKQLTTTFNEYNEKNSRMRKKNYAIRKSRQKRQRDVQKLFPYFDCKIVKKQKKILFDSKPSSREEPMNSLLLKAKVLHNVIK